LHAEGKIPTAWAREEDCRIGKGPLSFTDRKLWRRLTAKIDEGEMNGFDAGIIHFLNQFAQRSWFADCLISVVADNDLLSGGFIMSIFWWAWFRDDKAEEKDRQFILSTIFLASLALFLARALALLLPFRERPLRNPMLEFHVPFGVDAHVLLGWSSFPSDHAVFFFALATSIFFLSRRLGIAAFSYVFFLICLPSVYQGIHYPSDILAGALLGVSTACLSLIKRVRRFLSFKPMLWLERSPASFYPCFYLITFLFGTKFDSLRAIVTSAWHVSYRVLHHRL
jgi:undecaprenyl-diphosphatase